MFGLWEKKIVWLLIIEDHLLTSNIQNTYLKSIAARSKRLFILNCNRFWIVCADSFHCCSSNKMRSSKSTFAMYGKIKIGWPIVEIPSEVLNWKILVLSLRFREQVSEQNRDKEGWKKKTQTIGTCMALCGHGHGSNEWKHSFCSRCLLYLKCAIWFNVIFHSHSFLNSFYHITSDMHYISIFHIKNFERILMDEQQQKN